MSAHVSERSGREQLRYGSQRWLPLFVAAVVAGVAAGVAVRTLVKDGAQGHHSSSISSSIELSKSSEPAPVVLTVRATATLPPLRRQKSQSHASSVNAASTVAGSAAISNGSSNIRPSESSQSSSSSTPVQTRSTPTNPTRGDSEEVHHESNGGV